MNISIGYNGISADLCTVYYIFYIVFLPINYSWNIRWDKQERRMAWQNIYINPGLLLFLLLFSSYRSLPSSITFHETVLNSHTQLIRVQPNTDTVTKHGLLNFIFEGKRLKSMFRSNKLFIVKMLFASLEIILIYFPCNGILFIFFLRSNEI